MRWAFLTVLTHYWVLISEVMRGQLALGYLFGQIEAPNFNTSAGVFLVGSLQYIIQPAI